jgi:HEAT repeat protein
MAVWSHAGHLPPLLVPLAFGVVVPLLLLVDRYQHGPGREAPAETVALAADLRDRDPSVRLQARLALAAAGAPAVPALCRAIQEGDSDTRADALGALLLIPGTVRIGEAVPALIQALGDPSLHVRYGAMAALRRAGPRAREAVPALLRALGNGHCGIRDEALETLRHIGVSPADHAERRGGGSAGRR